MERLIRLHRFRYTVKNIDGVFNMHIFEIHTIECELVDRTFISSVFLFVSFGSKAKLRYLLGFRMFHTRYISKEVFSKLLFSSRSR